VTRTLRTPWLDNPQDVTMWVTPQAEPLEP
jgi:hypothetical protein